MKNETNHRRPGDRPGGGNRPGGNRPCGCGGPRPGPRPGHAYGQGPKCPCPCGWITRPEDCDRVYDECRWCGLPREECERRRNECAQQWADWPFYRGPCPGSRTCDDFCACKPVTSVYGLFARTEELDAQAGRPIHFSDEDPVESECLTRVRAGARVEVAGTYLVTITFNLPETPNARFHITVNGEEVEVGSEAFGPGDAPVERRNGPLHAVMQAIVTLPRGGVIGLTSDQDINMSGDNLRISMCVLRIA